MNGIASITVCAPFSHSNRPVWTMSGRPCCVTMGAAAVVSTREGGASMPFGITATSDLPNRRSTSHFMCLLHTKIRSA